MQVRLPGNPDMYHHNMDEFGILNERRSGNCDELYIETHLFN